MTGARTSQARGLYTVPFVSPPAPRTAEAVVLAVYAPPSAKLGEVIQSVVEITTSAEGKVVPKTSQAAVLVIYKTGVPDPSRSRAWTFSLDGHDFYVLDLGAEGTFVFDADTRQWAQFSTQGFNGQWNMIRGVMWGDRIIAGDKLYSVLWELVPDATEDEGWRAIAHAVTGGVQTRSRTYISQDNLRVMASFGVVGSDGASLVLRYSDDNGNTWSDPETVLITEGDYESEIAYRSLGSFMAPGRIFELSDSGGLIRIDGCDAGLDEFDVSK